VKKCGTVVSQRMQGVGCKTGESGFYTCNERPYSMGTWAGGGGGSLAVEMARPSS